MKYRQQKTGKAGKTETTKESKDGMTKNQAYNFIFFRGK